MDLYLRLVIAEVDVRDGSLENRFDSLGSIQHIALCVKGADILSLHRSSAGLQLEGQAKTTCGRSDRDVSGSFFVLTPLFPPSTGLIEKTMTKFVSGEKRKIEGGSEFGQ